jgi:ribosomal protein L11 methyltransferase
VTNPPAARPRYWQLTVPAPSDVSEALTNYLWDLGALGVVEEERPGQEAELQAFFPEGVEPDRLEVNVREYVASLDALGFAGTRPPRIAPVVDENWATAWREHFRPIVVGRRFVVAPPWDAVDVPGRATITIDPGRAFGTGHHATTAGCLQAIERIVVRERPDSAIDLGAGTGILAIGAAMLGVRSVRAVDTDPDAVAATEANAAANGVTAVVHAACADAGTLDADPAPLVVANLLASAHRALGARYASLVAPGGLLVLGGILDAEAALVEASLGLHGFARVDASSHEGWTTLVFRRGPAASSDGGDATVRDRR